ncbi:hypothetical protein [Microcoleus sp. bin38.metabat.b11b12b14.051]|uniref:hypothetical protein n=1 Tax=Microcoleus sp. bin38.metabat.b11b12b14.051 TaxID=2742709 RepID=UPI0025D21D0A|nr:hypothetical protein [Microcoleus sp. bin38.metabat.b11b12b14.051]
MSSLLPSQKWFAVRPKVPSQAADFRARARCRSHLRLSDTIRVPQFNPSLNWHQPGLELSKIAIVKTGQSYSKIV